MKIMPFFEFSLCKFKVNSRKMKTNKVAIHYNLCRLVERENKKCKIEFFFLFIYLAQESVKERVETEANVLLA